MRDSHEEEKEGGAAGRGGANNWYHELGCLGASLLLPAGGVPTVAASVSGAR